MGNAFAEVVTTANNNRSDISSNSVGLGLSISKKINLISEIFLYDDDIFYKKYKKNRKNPIKKDYIFAMPEIFYENFLNNDNLDNHYGVGINIGYGYKKFDGFASIGLLNSNFSYKIDGQNYTENENAFYYGLGLDYNFTKYIATRLGAKFYSLNFAYSEDSQKYQLKNNSVSLSLVLKL